MKTIKVSELIVPLEEYATIRSGATLYEAVLQLEETQEAFDQSKYRHRAILVLDDNDQVIGKLSQLDVLKGLEPKYGQMAEMKESTRFGFSKAFLKQIREQYNLFDSPMADICKKAGNIRVDDCMYTLNEGEYIEADATLDMAIHQLVMGHHQSLLVKGGHRIIGVLRLTDVFAAVFHAMKTCHL